MKHKLLRFINRYQSRIEVEAHKESKFTGRTTHKILSMALAVGNLKLLVAYLACAFMFVYIISGWLL